MRESIVLANTQIAEFAFTQEHGQRKRAEGCGCRSCKLDYVEAKDRTDWLFSEGQWTMVSQGFKDGRVVRFDHSDWYQDIEDNET